MRPEFIYLHRSVRSIPISRPRAYAGVGLALLLTSAVIYFGTFLLAAHSSLTGFILRSTRIEIAGTTTTGVFPHFGPVSVPDIPFPNAHAIPLRTAILFVVSLFGLTLVHRKYPLSRNFVVFLIILLCTAAGVIILNPSFRFDSVMFQEIWLRGEILVWILLPSVSAFLFFLTLPSVAGGIGWTLLLQIYAVVWSAVRLAFCLGVLHYTGILFLPLLWFCLGILFDLVYILVFYSLALRSAIVLADSERKT